MNCKLMEACRPLAEYSWLIKEIRNNIDRVGNVEVAVSKAIDDMPKTYEIRKFSVVHKTEVANMLLTEWNEQDAIESIRREGLEAGIIGAVNLLRSTGMNDETIISKIAEQYNLSYEKAKS